MDALREDPHGRSLNIDADELRHLLVVLGRSDECRRGAVHEIEERLPQIATSYGAPKASAVDLGFVMRREREVPWSSPVPAKGKRPWTGHCLFWTASSSPAGT